MPNIDFGAMITVEARQARETARAQEQARLEATLYLAQTDWMVVRQAETGRPVPADVTARRDQARETL